MDLRARKEEKLDAEMLENIELLMELDIFEDEDDFETLSNLDEDSDDEE